MAQPLVWLADVLRAARLRVVETDGWRDRAARGTPPRPVGVLNHHTATPASYARPAPTVRMCITGRPDLDGPLCHAVIAFDGTVHMIAAGRANHAGRAKASGPNPGGDGNTLYVGFEWDYAGTTPPSPQQYESAVRANAAVLRHLGRTAESARAHAETSVTGKWDPGHAPGRTIDMAKFRGDVARAMTGTPIQEVDDLTPEQDAILRRIEHELLGPRGEGGRIQGWGTEIGPRTLVAMLVDLVNALLAPKPSRAPGAEHLRVPLPDAVRDTNGLVYGVLPQLLGQLTAAINAASGTDPAAVAAALRPVLVELVGPVVDEAVRAAVGADNREQAEAIVTELAQRLAGREAAA